MVDISRRTMFVGIFLLGGALLGVVLGFVALNHEDESDKVTAEDVIVTAETNEQGEQTGIVKVENTADTEIYIYNDVDTTGVRRTIDPNSTISYDAETHQAVSIHSKEETLYFIINHKDDPDDSNYITVKRDSDSD